MFGFSDGWYILCSWITFTVILGFIYVEIPSLLLIASAALLFIAFEGAEMDSTVRFDEAHLSQRGH